VSIDHTSESVRRFEPLAVVPLRWLIFLPLVLVLAAGPAGTQGEAFCSNTAVQQFYACRYEAKNDSFVATAICTNVSDGEEREECTEEAQANLNEAIGLCAEQRTARLELCAVLGEGRYDPNFDPNLFDNDFTNLTNPNPYFPFTIGNVWIFESEDETTRIEIMDATKLIEGVTCIVVNDLVSEDDDPIENTDDWFAQRKDGTVDYCGEIARDFETFEGDDPMAPELVSIEGSFKAGRDGAQSGTLFPGSPAVGEAYRQEWSPGNAEDAATVLAVTYVFGSDPDLDELVPQELADTFCEEEAPCVVTGEFTPIEPGVFERKYYARGIGKFLEVNVGDEEVSQLVECNFDARCDEL